MDQFQVLCLRNPRRAWLILALLINIVSRAVIEEDAPVDLRLVSLHGPLPRHGPFQWPPW